MLPEISFSVYRFQFQVQRPFVYENHPGFIWRGALGYALRKTACTTGQAACAGCPLAGSCAHSVLFEEFPHPFVPSVHDAKAVKPYIITIPDADEEEPFTKTVSIVLVGRANAYYLYLIQAMLTAGADGIDKARHRLTLSRVTQIRAKGEAHTLFEVDKGFIAKALPPEIPPFVERPSHISLHLKTAVCLKSNRRSPEHNRTFSVQSWLLSLVRRTADLSAYWDHPLSNTGARIQEAKQIIDTQQNVHWQSALRRFSSRQKESIDFSGYVGDLRFNLDAYPDLWPWVWIGQWFGVGKGALMGLGQYRIE